jgi:hypothetical protein
MSDLDSALWKRMTLVQKENRPFSYLDFVPNFELDGQSYSIAYGTFRNKISDMLKAGKIQVVRYSPQAFYTLKGQEFTDPMTGYHTGVQSPLYYRHLSNDPVYRIIQNLPLGQRALHDIRLRFEAKGIWSIISSNSKYNVNSLSKDIFLGSMTISELNIDVTVHKTDTVSVIIGCSYEPVIVDINGVIRLSNALVRVEEKLSRIIEDCGNIINQANVVIIPNYLDWIVTMWHFGADALITYEGEKIYTSWEVGQHALITAYAKDWKDGKSRIRIEKQEYPKKSLADALEEKLNANNVVEAE